MIHLLLSLALIGTRPAAASALRYRNSLRACQDTLRRSDELALRSWLSTRAALVLGDVDHITLSHYRKLDPEYAGRRAFAVDEILEVLSEQSNGNLSDQVLRRRSWQMRLLGDSWATPAGVTLCLLGDRLRWCDASLKPSRGEFVIQLHWEEPAPMALIDQLPDLVKAAHAAGPAARAPLRLVRAGDPFDGELYIVVDVSGPPEARYAVALGLLKQLEEKLSNQAVAARRR